MCEGKADTQPIWTKYVMPGEPNRPLPVDTLSLMSQTLENLWEKPDMGAAHAWQYGGLTALPDDVLASVETEMHPERGYDIFGRYLPQNNKPSSTPDAGVNVIFENDTYKAKCYGYVMLIDNVLSVQPPIWMDTGAVHVYWCLLDKRARPVEEAHVQKHLDHLHVSEGIENETLQALFSQVREGVHECNAHLVAKGVPPENGEDARLEILVDTNRRAGALRGDGSLDFREVDFSPEISVGQEIARLHPATTGQPGKNVHRETAPAHPGIPIRLNPERHVIMREDKGVQRFYAEKEGVLKLTRDSISVVDLLVIDGDINYKTGNLNFNGEIFIKGNVGPSFSVVADSNITVIGNVEAGAKLVSKNNITVGKGIYGRKTRAMALGNVMAQFVNEANVQCGRCIYLGSHANLAYLRAGARLRVGLATGQRGGCILGGQTWVYRSIDAHTVGAPNQMATEVNVGVNPDQAEKLDELDTQLQEANKLIVRYLQRFDLEKVDVPQIQNILAASTGPRKKVLALSAKQLGQAVQAQQKLLKERKQIENSVGKLQHDAAVIIRNRVMPGVLIRVGDHSQKIAGVLKTPHYRIRKNRLVNR